MYMIIYASPSENDELDTDLSLYNAQTFAAQRDIVVSTILHYVYLMTFLTGSDTFASREYTITLTKLV